MSYNTVTVKQLKDKLQSVLDELEEYDEDAELKVASNTYFVGSTWYMQYGSAGFISLDPINVKEEDEEEKEEE